MKNKVKDTREKAKARKAKEIAEIAYFTEMGDMWHTREGWKEEGRKVNKGAPFKTGTELNEGHDKWYSPFTKYEEYYNIIDTHK